MSCKDHLPKITLANQAGQTFETVAGYKDSLNPKEQQAWLSRYQKIYQIVLEQDDEEWQNELLWFCDRNPNVGLSEMLAVGETLGGHWRFSGSEAHRKSKELQKELTELQARTEACLKAGLPPLVFETKALAVRRLQAFYQGILQGEGKTSPAMQQLYRELDERKEQLFENRVGDLSDYLAELPKYTVWHSAYQGKRNLWLRYYRPLVGARSQEARRWLEKALIHTQTSEEVEDLLQEIDGHFDIKDTASLKWLWEGVLTGQVTCEVPLPNTPSKLWQKLKGQVTKTPAVQKIKRPLAPSTRAAFQKALSKAFAKTSYQPIDLGHTYPEVWNYYFEHQNEIDWQNNFFRRPAQAFFGPNAVPERDFTYAEFAQKLSSYAGRNFDASQPPVRTINFAKDPKIKTVLSKKQVQPTKTGGTTGWQNN